MNIEIKILREKDRFNVKFPCLMAYEELNPDLVVLFDSPSHGKAIVRKGILNLDASRELWNSTSSGQWVPCSIKLKHKQNADN